MSDDVLPEGYVIPPDLVVRALRERRGMVNDYECRDKTLDIDVQLTEYFPRSVAIRNPNYMVGTRLSTVAALPDSDKLYPFSGELLLRGTQGGDASSEGIFAWGLEQFMQEAATLAQLNHSNITRVYRAFRHNGTAYMTSQLIKGSTLQDAAQNREFSQDDLDSLAAQAISALSMLHASGVYHRDLTPENVIIRAEDGGPVLTNFTSVAAQRRALANNVVEQQTTIIVARNYAAPEVLAPNPQLGPGIDIYGLAACLYYAITRRPPPAATDRAIGNDVLKLSNQVPKGRYRASFLEAVEQGLSLRPNERATTLDVWRTKLLDSSSKVRIEAQQIFISYRRVDTAVTAHALYRALQEHFGKERIFFDVDTIPAGEDFRQHIRRCMDRSAVCIALVGKKWLRRKPLTNWLGWSREGDHVAIEIELALGAKVPIIPVLIGGSSMPAPRALPDTIAAFSYINARSFKTDVPTAGELQYLVAVIKDLLERPASDV